MTSKDDSIVAVTNSTKPQSDRIHHEPTRKGVHEHEAEKGVCASGGTRKDSKGPECDCRHRFLLHVLWAVLATLVVSFAIGQLQFASIRQPYPSSTPLKETHGAPTMPTSSWPATASSSPLPSSHAITVASDIIAACTLRPPSQSHISNLLSACLCLMERSSETIEPVVETIVCKSREVVSLDKSFANFSP